MVDSVYAEYGSHEELIAAADALGRRGYLGLHAYTPYATAELGEALRARPSRLPFVVFAGGMTGAGVAYALQWFLVAFLYPLDVGGRPPHMPLAFVVITFEMGILAAALTAVAGVFVRARLFRLHDRLFEIEGIESASESRHWLRLDLLADPHDAARVAEDLAATAPLRTVHLTGRGR
jgi:hypothetical protein